MSGMIQQPQPPSTGTLTRLPSGGWGVKSQSPAPAKQQGAAGLNVSMNVQPDAIVGALQEFGQILMQAAQMFAQASAQSGQMVASQIQQLTAAVQRIQPVIQVSPTPLSIQPSPVSTPVTVHAQPGLVQVDANVKLPPRPDGERKIKVTMNDDGSAEAVVGEGSDKGEAKEDAS